MSNDQKKDFAKNLSKVIKYEQKIAYPLMGVITRAGSQYYCDISIEGSTLVDVPCHGYPVVGDSVIIHFINGSLDMPVADCARRLPVSNSELREWESMECFNYLNNGDFSRGSSYYNGNFEIIENESYTMGNNSCLLGTLSHENTINQAQVYYIESIVDISECTSDFFKFQCCYIGRGSLKIECFDNETNKIIKNLPKNMSYDYKIWKNNGRHDWRYNKEVYPCKNSETGKRYTKIKIRITNITPNRQINEFIGETTTNTVQQPLIVDALLVYDENSDQNYYLSKNDLVI